jgi:non-ribosomal peptide synthetase component F
MIGEIAAEPIELSGGYSRFDIGLDVVDSPDRLDLMAEYATELFDADRIERLLDHYAAALTNGLAAPETPADDVDIMSSAERNLVLHAFNPVPVG